MLTYCWSRVLVRTLLIMLLVAASELRLVAAFAANGDLVYSTNFSSRCQSGLGVGVAFDGEFLWYSCYRSTPDLYKAVALTGAVVASYNIAGGLGALAWDGNRKKIWAGWGGGSGANGDVRLIDPTTGSASVQFNAAAAVIVGLDDGLAYDAQDDSLYISDDVSTTIYHYTTGGILLRSFSWAGSGCYNSGLAIGGEFLFQGSDGCNHIWAVKRSDLSPAFNFPSGGQRDEGITCDSVTFSPKTVIWSMEAYDQNFGDALGRRAIAFEIPAGSCATGGGVDSDGDGLLDEWETNGITIDPDGDGPLPPQFIDLPAMGADKDKPDIFIHIDWMQDANHSHALASAAIKKVVDAFANSPYVSPAGSVGINLHVDQGPNSVLDFNTGATWGALLSRAGALTHIDDLGTTSGAMYNWSAFQTIKDKPGGFTETGRTPIFHYVISAHNAPYTRTGLFELKPNSGISRGIGASDLIVSLGSFTSGVGTANEAGTLMHELGHNLGLLHGGSDDVNFKPNYLSVMNYSFQLTGVFKGVGGIFDYSRSALPTLDENSLDETVGLGSAAAGYGTRHFCSFVFGFIDVWVPVTNADGPIDWNCDDDTTDNPTSYNINGQGFFDENLVGYDDWAHITFKGGAIGQAGITPDLPMETEEELLTTELADRILPWPPAGVNDLATFVPITSSFRATSNTSGCPAGFVGKFSFNARLADKNTSPPLSDLMAKVTTLTNGNLLQNADGGPAGVGATLTVPKAGNFSDGLLSPNEFVDVPFTICLKQMKAFSFFVDVLGLTQ